MDFREFSAKTVDEAITKACIELGSSSDELEIRTISEGSSGFLGIGSKPAVIQVRKKETAPAADENAEAAVDETEKDTASAAESSAEKEKPAEKTEQKASAETDASEKKSAEEAVSVEEDSQESKAEKPLHNHREIVTDRPDEEIAAMKASAEKFLDGVFKAMELPVTISMEYVKDEGSLDIDLEGEDMGVLIGKRGQTLDSLQYLVSLVVNRDLKNYVRVKLDTEDYRRRRKETLENLAKNIAAKVKRTRRPVSLEAMNPYERRIIHAALQGNKYVETHSEGNEPYRHVVVTLKK